MMTFTYTSGELVKAGDQVLYRGEAGTVDQVVLERTGEMSNDWLLTQFPGGGVMVLASGFGRVFVSREDVSELLTFVSRSG